MTQESFKQGVTETGEQVTVAKAKKTILDILKTIDPNSLAATNRVEMMETKQEFRGPVEASDVRPITITVPAFCLGSIAAQLGEWANELERQRDGKRAADAWHDVADIFVRGVCKANVTRPLEGEA